MKGEKTILAAAAATPSPHAATPAHSHTHNSFLLSFLSNTHARTHAQMMLANEAYNAPVLGGMGGQA